jgi:hypothetical protein
VREAPVAQLLAASGTPSYHELRTLLPPNKSYQVRLASVEPRKAYPGPEGCHGCTRHCATLCDLPRLSATLLCDLRNFIKIIANDRKTSIHMTSFFFVPRSSATFRDFARLVSATLAATMRRSGPGYASRTSRKHIRHNFSTSEGESFTTDRAVALEFVEPRVR